jgi:hypothetical protein
MKRSFAILVIVLLALLAAALAPMFNGFGNSSPFDLAGGGVPAQALASASGSCTSDG